jgi:acetyl-CoA carboxylase alpha subunit
MADIPESLRKALGRLAETIGLKLSEVKKLEELRTRLAAVKASNVDREEETKDQIRSLEARALKKQEEYEKARGQVREVIADEIERTFRDLDRISGPHRIISRNIEQISIVQSKIDEVIAARDRGASEEEVDLVAMTLEEEFESLRTGDRATEDLQKERYERGEQERVNIKKRVSQIRGPEKVPGLSKEAEQRLKKLKADYEGET